MKTVTSRSRRRQLQTHTARSQRGISLIEMLVGVVIGLLTIAVAMGALIVARSTSGTISDASEIQQQAAYAMRVIGRQMRQAGVIRLELSATGQPAASDALAHFEKVALVDESKALPLVPYGIQEVDGNLAIGFIKKPMQLTTGGQNDALITDCLGGVETLEGGGMYSIFNFDKNELRCATAKGVKSPQPVVRNVAAFTVRYLEQDTSVSGRPKIIYHDRISDEKTWTKVRAVEVCLELYGNERIDLPAEASYQACGGDKVAYKDLPAPRNARMHIAFRNLFQLRSLGGLPERL